MPSPNADVKFMLTLPVRKNASKSNLAAAAALAALLLMSAVTVISPIGIQSAAAGAFSGINGQIVFTSSRDGNDEIYVMNPDGSGQTRLTNNPTIDWNPSWSPDGTKIVFISDRDTSHGDFQIYVMNADGSGVVRLTNNPGWDVEPTWSPDGTKIAFSRNGEISVMNADGTGVTGLTVGREPSWSPDGTKIVFVGFDGGIVVMNADGTEQTTLIASGVRGIAPSWSPDGTKIVFASLANIGGADIMIMNSDGTNPTKLSTGESFLLAGILNASWSPDGTKIAISKVVSFQRGSEIVVMNPDGTEQKSLTYNAAHDFDPDWGSRQPSVVPPVLTVNAVSPTGFGAFHMYSKILSSDGTVLQQGFTPMTFTGESGKTYTVTVANYVGRSFEQWEDGSSERRRTVTLSAGDITLTAFYIDFFSKSGFTPLTYTNTIEVPRTGTVRLGPDLTVNAVSLDGSKELHMWTVIKAENSNDGTITTYTVALSNYKDRVFDHWEDGSTDRIRSLTVSANTTITAYYTTAIKAPNKVQFVYEDCGLSSAGCGVGTITCSDGTTTGPGPISLAFGLTVSKSPGSPAQGGWSAVVPGAAGASGASGALNTLSFDGANFKTEGDLSGAICNGDPMDNVKVTFSGQCGGTEVRFEATNGAKGRIQGDITCTPI